MSTTATTTATNKAGEAVSIEIPIPAVNRVEDWNAAIQDGYNKAGVEVPGGEAKPAAGAGTEPPKKDEPTEYRAKLNVNGTEMEFSGKDAGDVLNQYSAAVEAARLAAAPPPKKEEEKKPAISEAELFDIQLKLQKGDVTGLNDYLLKSDLIGQYLASQGVDVAKLKAATEKTQTDTVHDAWTTATNEFKAKVAAGEVDYVASPQNMKMMGYTIARLGLQPSVESMVKAWQEMKKEGLVFTAEKEEKKTDPPPKTATSSTAIGTAGAGKDAGKDQKTTIDPNRKFEIDMTQLTPHQYTEAYNTLIRQGVKPEQIIVKQ